MLPWPTVKIVIVGDGAVGKTSLVMTYMEDTFPGEYIPYVVEKCTKNRMVDGKPFSLELWDTPGQDGYDHLRPQCYTQTVKPDVFFICFSIATPISLESVTKKLWVGLTKHYRAADGGQPAVIRWYPEVSQHAPNTPMFLVGTKLDLRNDEKVLELLKSRDLSPVTTVQGLETKDAIGACRYIECSSLTRENLESLFDEILRVGLVATKRKSKKCLIM